MAGTVDLRVCGKDEFFINKGFFQLLQIALSELFCQRLDFEQERLPGRYPSVLVKRQSPGWNEAMEMEMVHESLAPCVQNRNESELSLKTPLRILGKCLQGLIDGSKKDCQGDHFIAQDNRIKLMRYSKDQVEVATGQQFGFTVIEPFFFDQALALGAVPVTA